VQRLTENAIERGHHAEDLAKAIDALKSKLTPDQLTKVADIEARLSARQEGPGSHFGPPHHGAGPGPDDGPGGPADETPPPTPSEQSKKGRCAKRSTAPSNFEARCYALRPLTA
jgi:hypothetical protein